MWWIRIGVEEALNHREVCTNCRYTQGMDSTHTHTHTLFQLNQDSTAHTFPQANDISICALACGEYGTVWRMHRISEMYAQLIDIHKGITSAHTLLQLTQDSTEHTFHHTKNTSTRVIACREYGMVWKMRWISEMRAQIIDERKVTKTVLVGYLTQSWNTWEVKKNVTETQASIANTAHELQGWRTRVVPNGQTVSTDSEAKNGRHHIGWIRCKWWFMRTKSEC